MTLSRSEITRIKILQEGLEMWKEDVSALNNHSLSKRLGIAHGTIMYHFPEGVKCAIANYALKVKDKRVIAHLIVSGHKSVKNLTVDEKTKYLSESLH